MILSVGPAHTHLEDSVEQIPRSPPAGPQVITVHPTGHSLSTFYCSLTGRIEHTIAVQFSSLLHSVKGHKAPQLNPNILVYCGNIIWPLKQWKVSLGQHLWVGQEKVS